jgi:hypothetical protein
MPSRIRQAGADRYLWNGLAVWTMVILAGLVQGSPVSRRLILRWCAALVAVTVSVLGATGLPAYAAAGVGYVRLAHLSPDTPDVDVYLSTVGGGTPKVFHGVGYGTVSSYLPVPPGTYAVAMRLSGAPATDPPVLTTDVTVVAGRAYLVAGVGNHANLGLKVIDDDLSPPPAGRAKVRVLQASVRAPVLDLAIQGGPTVASGVAFATTTGYYTVDPGRWTLAVKGTNGGPSGTLSARLAAGNVYSLLVLDAKTGGLTAQLRLDAAGPGSMPNGGVATGAGGTRPDPYPLRPWLPAGVVLVLMAGAAAALRYRRVALRGR